MIDLLCNQLKRYENVKFDEAKLRKELDCEFVSQLRHVGFCMITPDAIIRNKEGEILEYLYQQGFKILDFELKYLTEEEIEEIYKYTFTNKIMNNFKTHWWLTRKSYGLGPALGLLVYREEIPEPYEGLYQYLVYIKGASDPTKLLDKDSIRAKFHSHSKTLALFHSSDDFISIVRESLMFFNWNQLKNGLKGASEHSNGYSITHIKEYLVHDPNVDVSGFEILYRVKYRILNVIRKYLRQISINSLENVFEQLERQYNRCLLESKTRTGYIHEKKHFNLYLQEENRLLESCKHTFICIANRLVEDQISLTGEDHFKKSCDMSNRLTLLFLIPLLSDSDQFGEVDTEDVFHQLRQNHVYVSDWEKIAVQNLLFFY